MKLNCVNLTLFFFVSPPKKNFLFLILYYKRASSFNFFDSPWVLDCSTTLITIIVFVIVLSFLSLLVTRCVVLCWVLSLSFPHIHSSIQSNPSPPCPSIPDPFPPSSYSSSSSFLQPSLPTQITR